MTHQWDARFGRAAEFFCETHGTASSECRWIHRAWAIGTTALLGATIGSLADNENGALTGALIGGAIGAAFPEVAELVRAQKLNEAVHLLPG